jgi:hypothetical protein
MRSTPLETFDNILGKLMIGIISFFLGVIVVGQFTNNQVVMLITGLITSGIMVLELKKSFFIIKARQFILVVGLSTLFFTILFGAYENWSILPNADATVYFMIAKGHWTVKTFVVITSAITYFFQLRHYFIWRKQQNQPK